MKLRTVAVSLLALVLAGCSEEADIRAAIDNHLRSQGSLCFFELKPKPDDPNLYSLPRLGVNAITPRTDVAALVAAGLVEIKRIEWEWMINYELFALTEEGKKYFRKGGDMFHPDQLCAGTKVLDTVENYTTPADVGGMKASRVSYRYKYDGLPQWAKLPAVMEAFPEFNERAEEIVFVVQTNKGWMVQR